MVRPHIEERTPREAQARAVVIDAVIARTIVWLAGGTMAACVGIGLWVGITVQNFNSRIAGIEDRRSARDAQIASLVAADAEAERRLTALEVTITGISALKEQMNHGFADLGRRLDRMER